MRVWLRERVAVCVCSLTQHAKRMSHIVLSPVASLVSPGFLILFHKCSTFEKRLLYINCVFCFYLQLLSETFLSVRTQEYIVINIKTSLYKVTFILVRF
jgi:hypothetical protein